jgi:hypothetical protein
MGRLRKPSPLPLFGPKHKQHFFTLVTKPSFPRKRESRVSCEDRNPVLEWMRERVRGQYQKATSKNVIPAPIFTGINSSRNPEKQSLDAASSAA